MSANDSFTAVDVLVARMESNPEDFMVNGKLREIANAIYEMVINYPDNAQSNLKWILTEQEQIRLMAAYRNFARMQFQKDLFRTILADPNEERERVRIENNGTTKIIGTQEVLDKVQGIFTKTHDDYMKRTEAARGIPWGGGFSDAELTYIKSK